jgi:CMP/dCMP kinase
MVIAIDGPAGAGKSTVARVVAAALGFTYLDSGAMYRSVALVGLERNAALDSPDEMGEIADGLEVGVANGRVMLDGRDVSEAIREPTVSAAASRVSVHPQVRDAMVSRQRALIDSGAFVAEGRDIGTVVSPQAPLKVYLIASDEVRARRRAVETGEPFAAVLASHQQRDDRDRGRRHSALRPAPDAVEIDTTSLTVEETSERIIALVRERGIA